MSASATHTIISDVPPSSRRAQQARSTNRKRSSFLHMKGTEDNSVTAVQAGDLVEYDDLYRTHHERVLRLCRLLLSDPDEANDVTQEVFLKLFQAQQTEERTMVWAAWLTRVTVNACRDRRRSGWWKWWRERHVEFTEDFAAGTLTPEQAALGNETRRAVWQSLRALLARQQEVFVLRQVEGWSTEEVAETLGLSPGSIKRHLYRAVQQMRKSLGGRP
jgi:RNA polymerase sigma-70 factor, ECF subfamily